MTRLTLRPLCGLGQVSIDSFAALAQMSLAHAGIRDLRGGRVENERSAQQPHLM
jgi:hypothetical protein